MINNVLRFHMKRRRRRRRRKDPLNLTDNGKRMVTTIVISWVGCEKKKRGEQIVKSKMFKGYSYKKIKNKK